MGRGLRVLRVAAALAVTGLTAAPASTLGAVPASFEVGAASVSFTPPGAGKLHDDPADCASGSQRSQFGGPRGFAFQEPYADRDGNGRYDLGESYLDCNGNLRWDGNYLGGGADTPRHYDHVADDVGARAIVVSNGVGTIAVEVLDNEGAFGVYLQRIRDRVAADGYDLDGIFISSTHDESAPDTIGIAGPTDPVLDTVPFSSVNDYFADYMVERSAIAIERAMTRIRPASIRYSEAREPPRLRQCWSSYPFVDDALMPTMQAIAPGGRVIATLADVSQHAETLGFNDNDAQRNWISSDWVHAFRAKLESRFGGVAIEMAGSIGSVETPEVFASPLSRAPQRFVDEPHPAGCRTLFNAPRGETPKPTGYSRETRALGASLAGAVAGALANRSRPSRSGAIWGERRELCLPVENALFAVGGLAGVFAQRQGYVNDCATEVPILPNGGTTATEILTAVAAFRIGDGEFISIPGEVFPFTFLRGALGPDDLPNPGYSLPPWPLPHMHTRYRFIDGLAEDMIGYIFPRGNAVGVPSLTNLDPSSRDRFGCGHSDDSEAASSQAGDMIGTAIVELLDAHGKPERIVKGRYVLRNGDRSRDPLGGTTVKCDVDRVHGGSEPAVGVWTPGGGVARPTSWMTLSGRPQARPDRNTRGYFTPSGRRVWVDVYSPLPEP